MLDGLRHWRRRKILRRGAVADAEWRDALERLPILDGLSDPERARLRELTALFLGGRQILPVAGLDMDRTMALHIAVQACLPVLNLGLSWYRLCSTVVLYPGGFVARHSYQDESGVQHEEAAPLSGEAWDQGPVVLSWNDAAASGRRDGFNVVIHEFAHKLDMLNGDANGFPPLHRGMEQEVWTSVFASAFDDFRDSVERGLVDSRIDAYAAESPGEFFAVVSEVFFALPHALLTRYPDVYRQLSAFYRQSPAERLSD